jgi:hypothetical protein
MQFMAYHLEIHTLKELGIDGRLIVKRILKLGTGFHLITIGKSCGLFSTR